MVGEIPIFFWGRKMDPFGYEQQNSEFTAALILPGENFYLSSFFKLVSWAIPKTVSDCLIEPCEILLTLEKKWPLGPAGITGLFYVIYFAVDPQLPFFGVLES